MASTTQKKSFVYFNKWRVVVHPDGYLIFEPPRSQVRRRRRIDHFTVPYEPLRGGRDRGLIRPHGSRGFGARKVHCAIDAQTMTLVPVEKGAGHWPNIVKFGEAELERFASAMERVRDIIMPNIQHGPSEIILDRIVWLEVPTVERMREFLQIALQIDDENRTIRLLPDLAAAERWTNSITFEEMVHDVDEGVRIVDEHHDAFAVPTVMCIGLRVREGAPEDWDPIEDIEYVRLFHHCFPDGREVWSLVPRVGIDREALRRFFREELGPRFGQFLVAVLDGLGVEYDRDELLAAWAA